MMINHQRNRNLTETRHPLDEQLDRRVIPAAGGWGGGTREPPHPTGGARAVQPFRAAVWSSRSHDVCTRPPWPAVPFPGKSSPRRRVCDVLEGDCHNPGVRHRQKAEVKPPAKHQAAVTGDRLEVPMVTWADLQNTVFLFKKKTKQTTWR